MTDETKQIGLDETATAQLVRLPLWKSCLEDMLASGINYGVTYPAEFFEKKLRCPRTDMRFGLAISEIRRGLEMHGFYLSGRGLKGDSFIVLQPSANQDVMRSYSSAAVDALKRGVILGTNTRLDLLNAEDRRRHESMLEKMAIRLVLMKRSGTIHRELAGNKHKLLE
jgi:hypothetical protein